MHRSSLGETRRPRAAGAALAGVLAAALLLAILATPATAQVEPDAEDVLLEAKVAGCLAPLEGSYGVAVLNLDDGRYAFVGADIPFPMASMYKLLVMYRVFQAIDRGYLSPEDFVTIEEGDFEGGDDDYFYPGDSVTVASALDAMITASSNAAAYALTRAAGGWNPVITTADELGMPNTVFEDDFWSTPADLARFFQLLARQSLVSPAASQQMIDLLLGQRVADRLPALLPEGVRVAHKTGNLDGVRNDGGIVLSPGANYVIVIMSYPGDPDEQIPAEATISRLAYDHFSSAP